VTVTWWKIALLVVIIGVVFVCALVSPAYWGLIAWQEAVLLAVVCVGLLLTFYCYFTKRDDERVAAVTLAQAVFLALAFGAAAYYAMAAHNQAQATKEQLDATYLLAGRASLFVSDPIHTVRDFAGLYLMPAADCELTQRIGDWLMIEITNEGEGVAMNVEVCASWVPGSYEKGPEARPSGNMASIEALQWLLAHICSDHREYQVWREWRLLPHESRFLYFYPPREAKDDDPKDGRELRIRWRDPSYEPWENNILVFVRQEGHKKVWYTSWGARPHRR